MPGDISDMRNYRKDERILTWRRVPQPLGELSGARNPIAPISCTLPSAPPLDQRAADAFDLTVLQVVVNVLPHLLHVAGSDGKELLHAVGVERLAGEVVEPFDADHRF